MADTTDTKPPKAEASPKGVGKFVFWVLTLAIAGLVIFALIFYWQGHKSSILRNSLLVPTGTHLVDPAPTPPAMPA